MNDNDFNKVARSIIRCLGFAPEPHPCCGIHIYKNTWYLVLHADDQSGIQRGDCIKWAGTQEGNNVVIANPYMFLALRKNRKDRVADMVGLGADDICGLLVRPIELKIRPSQHIRYRTDSDN